MYSTKKVTYLGLLVSIAAFAVFLLVVVGGISSGSLAGALSGTTRALSGTTRALAGTTRAVAGAFSGTTRASAGASLFWLLGSVFIICRLFGGSASGHHPLGRSVFAPGQGLNVKRLVKVLKLPMFNYCILPP